MLGNAGHGVVSSKDVIQLFREREGDRVVADDRDGDRREVVSDLQLIGPKQLHRRRLSTCDLY